VGEDPRRAAVRRLLEPRSIAVVGASARPGSFGERLTVEALRSPGVERVHLVHPHHAEVQGRRTVPSLADLDETVDLVLLGVPDAALVDQVSLAAKRGDGGAVVFGSATGLADPLRAAAGNLPMVGGGCMGYLNPARGVRAMGYLERDDLTPGPIAFVTHSGSVFSAMLRTHRRLDYSLVVSSGQELVTSTADYLHYALDLPQTRVIGLFLETMRSIDSLRAALARAADQDVAVVALTVGTSEVGQSLVAAHSGAIAGGDAAWEALLRAYGVHRARSLDELIDTLELFAIGRRPVRPGLGVASIHDSGGERTYTADVAERLGVSFAQLSEATLSALAGRIDDGLAAGNPLDVWSTGADTEELFANCLAMLAADDSVGVTALAVDLVEEFDGDDAYPEALLRVHAELDEPFVALAPTSAAVHQPTAARLRTAGIPVLEGLESGLRALRHLVTHRRVTPPPLTTGSASGTVEVGGGFALLSSYGIPVPGSSTVTAPDDAVLTAEAVGWPVALKTAAEVAHKVDVGGVVLGLTDAAQVQAAYDDLAARLGPAVLVQAMAPAGVELALGVVRDPHLGPLVVLAAGGTLVELVAQRVVALPPFDESAALALLDEVPLISQLLDGVRGAPPADRAAVAAALAALSRLALDLPDHVDALDINPLICTPDGVVAVDVLVC